MHFMSKLKLLSKKIMKFIIFYHLSWEGDRLRFKLKNSTKHFYWNFFIYLLYQMLVGKLIIYLNIQQFLLNKLGTNVFLFFRT